MRRQRQLPASNIHARYTIEEQVSREARLMVRSVGGQGEIGSDLIARLDFNAFELLPCCIGQRSCARRNHEIVEIHQKQLSLVSYLSVRRRSFQSCFKALRRLGTEQIRSVVGAKIDGGRFEGVSKVRINDGFI